MPQAVSRWGNLWKFSTAKLESRGKRFKKIVRGQTSARPGQVGPSIIKKRKMSTRGGPQSKRDKRTKADEFTYIKKGHDNNQARTMLAKMTVAERRTLSLNCTGMRKRGQQQLCSLGKLDRLRSVKTERNVPERWAELVPDTVTFTTVGLLRAMATGLIKPLYSLEGKPACDASD